MTRLNIKQERATGLPPAESKYKNRHSTVAEGLTFHSEKEARRYAELKLLQKVGEVLEIELQPAFELQPGYRRNGKYIRPITYKADFRITWKDGRVTVEDVKGYKTEKYQIKKKILLFKYPELDFMEVD